MNDIPQPKEKSENSGPIPRTEVSRRTATRVAPFFYTVMLFGAVLVVPLSVFGLWIPDVFGQENQVAACELPDGSRVSLLQVYSTGFDYLSIVEISNKAGVFRATVDFDAPKCLHAEVLQRGGSVQFHWRNMATFTVDFQARTAEVEYSSGHRKLHDLKPI